MTLDMNIYMAVSRPVNACLVQNKSNYNKCDKTICEPQIKLIKMHIYDY